MIISPEAITYFLTGKQMIDHKLILKFAKLKGADVSDSMRKNISNFFSCKNNPSETTLKNITLLLKDIVKNDEYSDRIDSGILLDEVDLSTTELKLKYMEKIYSDFFRSANLEDSFLANEVNNTFKGLYRLVIEKENGASDAKIEKELSRSKLFPKIDYDDSLYLEIKNQVSAFNLDLLIYYFSCLALENEERDASSIQVMFEYLSQEITNSRNGEFKSPFACYISIIKLYYKKENKKITDKEIADTYDLDIRDFYFYKSGKRALSLKTIALIIEQGHILYFMVLFWTKLISPFTQDINSRLKIIDKINLYPKLLDVAKVEFCNIEIQNKKTGHD